MKLKRYRFTTELQTEALALVNEGLSLRQVAKVISKKYETKISHIAIYRWSVKDYFGFLA